MNKKEVFISIVLILFIVAMLGLTIWYLLKDAKPILNNNNTPPIYVYDEETTSNIPETGNDYIIKTSSDTNLRVLNEYTTEFFTAKKNLLIMFGSWCSHCKEELVDVEKIMTVYRNNKDVNVILIAHEYEDTLSDLITLVEQDVNFGNVEILVDLKRVIRKTLDPEANTVPISYVVDKNGMVLEKNNGAITLDIANDMLK